MVTDFWYQGADAISAQLEAARDGLVPVGTTNVGNLAGDGRSAAGSRSLPAISSATPPSLSQRWRHDRCSTQLRAGLPGVQGGLDFRAAGTIIGISFGVGKSDAAFDVSFNPVELDGHNVADYVAFIRAASSQRARQDGLGRRGFVARRRIRPNMTDPPVACAHRGFRFEMDKSTSSRRSPSHGSMSISTTTARTAPPSPSTTSPLPRRCGASASAAISPRATAPSSAFIGISRDRGIQRRCAQNFPLGQPPRHRPGSAGTYGEFTFGLNYSTGRSNSSPAASWTLAARGTASPDARASACASDRTGRGEGQGAHREGLEVRVAWRRDDSRSRPMRSPSGNRLGVLPKASIPPRAPRADRGRL